MSSPVCLSFCAHARGRGAQADWPVFKWSHDDQYIARISKDKKGEDVISIYQGARSHSRTHTHATRVVRTQCPR